MVEYLVEYYDQLARRDNKRPLWLRCTYMWGIHTDALTYKQETLLLAEFLQRFGGIFMTDDEVKEMVEDTARRHIEEGDYDND